MKVAYFLTTIKADAKFTPSICPTHTRFLDTFLGVATQQVLRQFDFGNIFIVNVPVGVSKGNLDGYSIGRG